MPFKSAYSEVGKWLLLLCGVASSLEQLLCSQLKLDIGPLQPFNFEQGLHTRSQGIRRHIYLHSTPTEQIAIGLVGRGKQVCQHESLLIMVSAGFAG